MQALGPNHPHTITSLTNLALLYRDEGKLEDAAQVLRRACALREAALGAQHPNTQSLRELLDQIERRLVL